MADNSSQPPLLSSMTSTMNPYELLEIIHNPATDTLARNSLNPITNSNDDPDTKDIDLNPRNKTWIRIFKPSQSQKTQLLPLIIYFHGGGFIRCNANSTIFHNFCKSMANQLSAIVLSVEYRLAPENRLPAAYEDAVESLIWVQNQAMDTVNGEPWLRNYGDFSKCFIMGCSAGGNIAYTSCLRASELDLDLEPIKICGLILNQPYFGGVERSESELRLVNDKKLPLVVNDLLWELGLPVGVNRDHVYCNPFIDENMGTKLRFIKKCLVTCSNEDPLVDRDIQFVKMLEGKGVQVMSWIEEFGFHGMAHSDPVKAQELFNVVKDFISSED